MIAVRFALQASLLWTAVTTLAHETVKPDSAVQLISPKDGETVHMPHPHLRWQKEASAGIEDRSKGSFNCLTPLI